MAVDREEALGLLQRDHAHNEDLTSSDKEFASQTRNTTASASPTRWMSAVVIAFVLLDLTIYAYITHILAKQGPTIVPEPPAKICDSYVGLDELYGTGQINASRHDPIINKPRRVGQVYKTHPNKASPVDVHRWLTPYGTVSPPDEHLHVSTNIRTIIQFHAIDYGMDSCQLVLRLPELGARLAEPFHFRGVDEVAVLDLCELDVDHLIDLTTLTWASRPTCRRVVGTFSSTPGHEVNLPRFPCKTRSLYSYEISCSTNNPDCLVDVWAGQNTTLGIFMYQHQTI